ALQFFVFFLSSRIRHTRSKRDWSSDVCSSDLASIWIGYAWADEPRCHASIVATGTDREAVASAAESLAGQLWHVREQFDFVGPPGTLADGVRAALAATEKPCFISDSGDNPGAGGTGDVTWTLTELLAMPEL